VVVVAMEIQPNLRLVVLAVEVMVVILPTVQIVKAMLVAQTLAAVAEVLFLFTLEQQLVVQAVQELLFLDTQMLTQLHLVQV
jgi:hypothetical protein